MENRLNLAYKILIYAGDSVIILSVAIILVGLIGAVSENIWLGKLGSEEYRDKKLNQKSVVPSIMFFFPLPFTTYTYVFFRVIFGEMPIKNLKDFFIREWKRIGGLRIKFK